MYERFRAIARVVKPHGRKGEVVTVCVDGLPQLMRVGLTVAVVPPALRGGRWHVVEACSDDDRSGQLVTLSGAATLKDAEGLVGKTLLARESDLPDDLALHDAPALVGREVCVEGTDERGWIEEVMIGPANDAWCVRTRAGEVILPVIDEVVSTVPESGPITLRLPDGLTWPSEEGGL